MTDSDEAPTAADDAQPVERRTDATPLLYEDLDAPAPTDPTPPTIARWLAFGSILLGGLLGGLIGFGTADLMVDSSAIVFLGGLVGAVACAIGVGVVAGLTLRAMNEWKSVDHPESETRASSGLVLRENPERPEHPGNSETTEKTDDA